MFTVKWVVRHRENQPVAIQDSVFIELDKVVASCKEDLYGMRTHHFAAPPDGFIVFSEEGRELRRWFEPPAPHA